MAVVVGSSGARLAFTLWIPSLACIRLCIYVSCMVTGFYGEYGGGYSTIPFVSNPRLASSHSCQARQTAWDQALPKGGAVHALFFKLYRCRPGTDYGTKVCQCAKKDPSRATRQPPGCTAATELLDLSVIYM